MDKNYIALEQFKTRFEKGGDPTSIMNDMEQYYNIPSRLSEEFNKKNLEVMDLYLKISSSRKL